MNMRIVAVCGMGIGTSIILKMNTEKALDRLGVDADVEVADIGTARGAAATANLVLTSAELAEEIGDLSVPVVVIDDFTNVDKIAQSISAHTQE
jgi:PTS system ascorbate-specific IIB component